MRNIFKVVSVVSVTNEDVQAAFQREWKDFEDSIQYTTAHNNQMDYVITSNTKDFEDKSRFIRYREVVACVQRRNLNLAFLSFTSWRRSGKNTAGGISYIE